MTGVRAVPRSARILAVAAVVLVADQLTKWWALENLSGRDIDLFWTLRLHLVFNRGASFGLGSRYAPLIAILVVVVAVVLLRTGQQLENRWAMLSVGVVLGGAIGNLADRLFRSGEGFLGGAVVDFIDVQWWPVFNVADIAVVLGAVALALTAGELGAAGERGVDEGRPGATP